MREFLKCYRSTQKRSLATHVSGVFVQIQRALNGRNGEVRIPVSGTFRSNNAEMLRTAALQGVGIAVLPRWAVLEELRSGALKRVLPEWEPPSSTIYAVYPGNRLMSMKVRAFVEHLARSFGRPPSWESKG